MKKLVFALLLLAGCVGKAPDHTLRAAPNANVAQFSVCDQSGYCLPVTDAGLPTSANFTGSVTTAPPTPCTASAFYGSLAGVVKDAGGLFFFASCYNTNANTQFLQVQNQASTPLQDAGLAPLEFPIFSNSATVVDHPAIGGVTFASGLAFDISGTAGGYYKPDGGASVNCSFCYQ